VTGTGPCERSIEVELPKVAVPGISTANGVSGGVGVFLWQFQHFSDGGAGPDMKQ
jgi:hypothetical protein